MNEEAPPMTQIIQTATQLFLTRGFKSVTMDDLATKMAMSKKTIYNYFKTKTSLVSASSEHIFEIISSGIDKIREQQLNPIEELFTINDFVLKNLNNESSSPHYQLQKYYPKIHTTLMKRQFSVAHECIIRNLNVGIQLGLFRSDVHIEAISRLYFLLITGSKDQELFPYSEFPAHKLTPIYLNYHIRGIATQKGIDILEKIQLKRAL